MEVVMDTIYQHVDPQPWDGKQHEIDPKYTFSGKEVCRVCWKPIMRVDDNEGPEGLKALLKF
jgi:hypothetical protein